MQKPQIIAESPRMRAVLEDLDRVSALDTTVLLTGESGTGKELAARLLHAAHPRRRTGPFVCVHCGAVPETLLESELFGHRRGSFTGAERDRVGRFEQADGGTLFLDEIGTMKPEAQVRLLRVLQERLVTPLGATDSRPVDVRIVAATNEDLQTRIRDGLFREDLYYRLATFPIRLPALRERASDVGPLARFLSRRVAERLGLDVCPPLSNEALEALGDHAWPGNVRELENALEFALVRGLGRERIEVGHLPPDVLAADGGATATSPIVTEDGVSFRTAITNLERDLILQSMHLAHGNKARAAELLQLKRTTFLEKLRRIEGLDPAAEAWDQPSRSSAEATG